MDNKVVRLKYGNTNTFLINGLLVDTDFAGTLHAFYKEIKRNGIGLKDIHYILATHYHPDHEGLIGELMRQGIGLLLVDIQKSSVHFSDYVFEREGLPFAPIDETQATVIACDESRAFLNDLGISGEIIHTPSHSPDSISLVLDDGDCFVGDLEPFEYIEVYGDNTALKADWDRILSFDPKRVFYSHCPEKVFG